jgi:hypothetical protein
MRRSRPVLALAAVPCALLLASMPLAAQQVYKWKDANGVTQYSSTPPANRDYETRQGDNRPAVQPGAEAKAPPPAADPACATARSNLAMLDTNSPLHMAGSDGKPDKTLTETERANQRTLMEAVIKVKCTPAPAPSDEPEES